MANSLILLATKPDSVTHMNLKPSHLSLSETRRPLCLFLVFNPTLVCRTSKNRPKAPKINFKRPSNLPVKSTPWQRETYSDILHAQTKHNVNDDFVQRIWRGELLKYNSVVWSSALSSIWSNLFLLQSLRHQDPDSKHSGCQNCCNLQLSGVTPNTICHNPLEETQKFRTILLCSHTW